MPGLPFTKELYNIKRLNEKVTDERKGERDKIARGRSINHKKSHYRKQKKYPV
jgi:hypothetical protein